MGWLCKQQSTGAVMDQTLGRGAIPCQASLQPLRVLYPRYRACGAVPTLLIKYPKAALVFQLGCVLSVHYWHVFNNSLARAAEDTPPSICCCNGSQHNCVRFGKMNLKFAFALNLRNRPKCQSGDGNAARRGEYYAMTCWPPMPRIHSARSWASHDVWG